MIRIRQATKKGYIECVNGGVADLSYPTSKLRRGRVQGGGNISPTLACSGASIFKVNEDRMGRLKIRKITSKEAWRLMSFRDSDYEKAEKIVSETQRYKAAGDSICKCVLMGIFSQLGIKGVIKWNDMCEDSIYKVIGDGTCLNNARRDEEIINPEAFIFESDKGEYRPMTKEEYNKLPNESRDWGSIVNEKGGV